MPSCPDRFAIASFAVLSLLGMAIVDFAPREGSNVVVVFAPWLGGATAIRRVTAAGASLVRTGRFPFILIVRPTSPTFAATAMSTGALAVFDAQAVGGCSRAGRAL